MRAMVVGFLLLAGCGAAPVPSRAPEPLQMASPAAQAKPVSGMNTASPTPQTTVGLGERMALGHGVTVNPLAVLEDSRCPADVTCIQAGHLRVRVAVEQPGGVIEKTATLGTTTLLPGGTLMFEWATEKRVREEQPDEPRLAFSYAPNIAR